jgi:hypothetical protein
LQHRRAYLRPFTPLGVRAGVRFRNPLRPNPRDVWGYEWTGGSNVVEVVISSLRKKLGDRAAALETVRGVGYRLGALD